MESAVQTITWEELQEKLEKHMKDSDEVDLIEPFMNQIINNELNISITNDQGERVVLD